MPKSQSRKKKSPRRVLALPEFEHAKTAVLICLTSASGQRTYDNAIREFVALGHGPQLCFLTGDVYVQHLAARIRNSNGHRVSVWSSAPIRACPECTSRNTPHPAWV